MLPPNCNQAVKAELIDYLNGLGTFKVGHLPRFERGHKKIEIFQTFLKEKCPSIQTLQDKNEILSSF